ncbi:ATPase involved in DNA repair [Thioploca ingrica]|uniref:ATPase involved in DNA repair n=1 Tax=Thioploca ingrica TaxID=40754 RepID=A0A090AI82_9GAMM|nr:ATPase involved in DNA repair [Thioploca ingrica]
MIFEELILSNFGIYQGRHVLQLTSSAPPRSIILLGGLNGSGKTTLLEALQLILYGKFSKYANQSNLAYFDYLRQLMNYHADPSQGTALELAFKHYREGKEEIIRVQRAWSINNNQFKETVAVQRDGVFDPVITDHWYDYVEEFIPARIANLFFFDGEKIAAFADAEQAADLLKTGIYALLGLDLVERLVTDLLMVERKRKAQLQSQLSREQIQLLAEQLNQLKPQLIAIDQQQTQVQDQLKQAQQEHNQLLNKYRQEGGERVEQKTFWETQLGITQQKQAQLDEQLREVASGEAPLLLITELLHQTEAQACREQEAKHNWEIDTALAEHNAKLLQFLQQHRLAQATLAAVENFLATAQVTRQQSLQTECYLQVDPTIFAGVQASQLQSIQTTVQELLAQSEDLQDEINRYERQLLSIPDPERLEAITQQRQQLQQKIDSLQSQLAVLAQQHHQLHHEMTRKQHELQQAYEIESKEQFTHEITQRVIKQAEQARNTLAQFNQAMLTKSIRQLETLILDGFRQLVRKNKLIQDITIDPHHYGLTLYTSNHEILTPKSLSAGEKQLLAISILWGLSRASGYPLPAIIDTPLSRLDSIHRNNLVKHYFPQASHQVILLSTDEEINEIHYRHLKPNIGREYHISYQEDQQTSVINPGYFFSY